MNNVKGLFPDGKYKDGKLPYFFEMEESIKVEDDFTRKFGTAIDNIKVTHNFLSDEQCDDYIKFMQMFEVKADRDHCYPLHMANGFQGSEHHDKYISEMTTLGDNMVKEAMRQWGEPMTKHNDCMLMVHPTGSYLDPHTDILDIHYVNNDPARDEGPSYEDQRKMFVNLWSGHMSILIYLNDDYGRGELYFPQHDYWIKPKKGDLVTFPGSLYYVHGVTAIESGIRYTASQWAKIDMMK